MLQKNVVECSNSGHCSHIKSMSRESGCINCESACIVYEGLSLGLCIYIYIRLIYGVFLFEFTASTPLRKDAGVFECFGCLIIVLLD